MLQGAILSFPWYKYVNNFTSYFSYRFNNIHALVQGTGEYDKLTQGLFENYLECKFKDPHMDGVSIWHLAT